MRQLLIVVLSLATAVTAAQRKPYQINAQTPEGQLLQKAGQEDDESKKIAIYQDYLAQFPQHDGVAYAWIQLQPLLLKAKQLDKVIEGGDVILKLEPENAPSAYNALQACEQKKDTAGVVSWANRTVEAAKKMLATPKPADEDDLATWKYQQDYAQQVVTRAEYSLYAQGLQTADPAKAVQLFAALEAMNPASEYMPQAGARYFICLLQLKDLPRAQKLAESMAARNMANDDMLLYLADVNLTGTQDYRKAADYATKLTETLPSMAAPQGVDPAAWEAKKKTSLGRAYWIAGVAQGSLNRWVESDKSMRAALPLLAGNNEMLPGAYFYIGLSNYKLAEGPKGDKTRMADARKYTTLCSQMKSAFQGPAQKNLAAMAGK
jgi:tetratricopeptide (TPR) repeat protein